MCIRKKNTHTNVKGINCIILCIGVYWELRNPLASGVGGGVDGI